MDCTAAEEKLSLRDPPQAENPAFAGFRFFFHIYTVFLLVLSFSICYIPHIDLRITSRFARQEDLSASTHFRRSRGIILLWSIICLFTVARFTCPPA